MARSSPRSKGSRTRRRELDLPFVSGNVSLYNESGEGAAVPASAIVAVRRRSRKRRQRRHARAEDAPVRRCCGSAAASSSSAVPCWRTCWASKARCRGYHTAPSARRSRSCTTRSRAACCCRAAPIRDGGMLTALARLAFDAHAARPHLGAEIDFGNPLCEAGGFLCEVSDDSGIDLTGVLRVGETSDKPRSGRQRRAFRDPAPVRNVVAAARRSSIRERAHRRSGVSRHELRGRNGASAARLRRRRGARALVEADDARAVRCLRAFRAASRTRTAFAPAPSPRTIA